MSARIESLLEQMLGELADMRDRTRILTDASLVRFGEMLKDDESRRESDRLHQELLEIRLRQARREELQLLGIYEQPKNTDTGAAADVPGSPCTSAEGTGTSTEATS